MKNIKLHKREPIKHFFKSEHGLIIENLRCSIRFLKNNPKKMRLRIQIWLPLIHITRDNSKWEIGNKYRVFVYH